MSDFVKGLELNAQFYNEIVAPVLKTHFPGVPYAAALIGWGSEVLGFDDVLSADHNWGLRFQIFLSEQARAKYSDAINQILNEQLPPHFRGFPTDFEIRVNKDQRAERKDRRRKHNIDIETIEGFFARYLGCHPHEELKAADWLTFPEHKLLAVTSGKVFYDGLGELERARRKFSYYPQDVWLYMLAANGRRFLKSRHLSVARGKPETIWARL